MKNEVALFFDSAARSWDSVNAPETGILDKITDIAGVSEGCTVLDAGCGTGVMFPFYFSRRVGFLTAIDISENMLSIAKRKFGSKAADYICCDITEYSPKRSFDCVLVHNAFPHFLPQSTALEKLKELTAPGGTLTIAHSISRAEVLRCHKNIPEIPAVLPEAQTLAEKFGENFENFTTMSDDRCYIVSARKKL